MRFKLLAIAMLIAWANTSDAQNARVRKLTTPLAGHVVLKDVVDKYGAEVYNLELPDPDEAKEAGVLKQIKEDIAKKYPRKRVDNKRNLAKTTSIQPPVVDISFVADSFPGIPPDNYVAVNKDSQAVSVMNSYISVHNTQTGQMTYRKSLMSFSASLGLNNVGIHTDNYKYDPKVIYDPEADRYICVMLNGINQYNWVVVGFSKTNNPTGAWNFYKFYGDYDNDSTFFDYPAIAITKKELFFTGNHVKDNVSWQTGFTKAVVYQVRKQDGYDGDSTLTYQLWDSITYNGQYVRNVFPVKGGASIHGPEQYFLSNRNYDVQNDTIFLEKIADTIGSANTSFTIEPIVADKSYGVPPDGRQPDTTTMLMTNDGRILGAYAENNEIQFVSASLDSATGGSCIYHGIISDYGTSPTIHAGIFAIDTLDFGYPNISYAGYHNGSNQSIISFDYTGPNKYAGLGAIFYDNGQFSDMVDIKQGSGSIKQLNDFQQRWGDYSGSQPDWGSLERVWVDGIFGRADHNYGNYMARLLSPYYNAVPAIHATNKISSVLYPNPALQFIRLSFSIDEEQVVNFVIYDIQGRMVDKVTTVFCNEGKNVIQFNTASLKPGTYFLKAVGNNGTVISSQSFIRQ